MKAEIAGLVVDLRFDEASREAWARGRYAAFKSRRKADVTLQILVVPSFPLRLPKVEGASLSVRPRAAGSGSSLTVVGRGMAAMMDLAGGGGSAILLESRFPINALLRAIVAFALLREDGLLLHAAGARVGGGAWVFPGRSGAGKSTLARRFPRADVLSDEVVAVRLRGGRVEACGTPFPGELGRPGRPGWLPLCGFAFLRGPRRPRLDPLSAAEALRRLLACTLGSWAIERDVPRLWKAASRLVRASACGDLGFGASEPRRSILARLDAWRRPPSRGRRRSPRRAGGR